MKMHYMPKEFRSVCGLQFIPCINPTDTPKRFFDLMSCGAEACRHCLRRVREESK